MARKSQRKVGPKAIVVILSLLASGSLALGQHAVTPPLPTEAPPNPVMPRNPDMPPDPGGPRNPVMPPDPSMPANPSMPPNPTLPGNGNAAPAPNASAPPAAETQTATQSQPMPAPLSRDCQIGNEQIVEQSPLPNVAAALQKRKQIRILAIGSSSSLGRRSSRVGGRSEQIRDILQQAIKGLDVVMINRGVSGELAAQAAMRVKNEVALQDPDLVLWQVGTNDALAYVPLEDLQATIVDNIHWLREHKVDVVLAGLQYVDRMAQDDHYKAVRELLREIAAKENVMIVRRYEAQQLLSQVEGSGAGLAPDEFERTDAGYTCLSQYMARAITLGIFGQSMRIHPITNPPTARPQN